MIRSVKILSRWVVRDGPRRLKLALCAGKTTDALLTTVEAELAKHVWLAGSPGPTIADVALYSYIARVVDLTPYGHVRAWLQRVEALTGFAAFRQSPIGLSAVA